MFRRAITVTENVIALHLKHNFCNIYPNFIKPQDRGINKCSFSHVASNTVNFLEVKKATNNNNILIIDVREPEEIKEHGKIPNSINIPLKTVPDALNGSDKEFQKLYKRLKPSMNTEIIVYCMSGKRASRAQKSALNMGFNKTRIYAGSWLDWVSKNQEIK